MNSTLLTIFTVVLATGLGVSIVYLLRRRARIESANADLYAMVFLIMWADGSFSSDEGEMLGVIIDRLSTSLSEERRVEMMQEMRNTRNSGRAFADYATSFVELMRHDPTALELAMEYLIMAAGSDGSFHPKEQELIFEAARIFGFSEAAVFKISERLKSQYETEEDSEGAEINSGAQSNSHEPLSEPVAHALRELGCEETDAPVIIKRRYRKAVMRFHPDKVKMRMGKSNEMVDRAEDKFRRIQSAYEILERAGRV